MSPRDDPARCGPATPTVATQPRQAAAAAARSEPDSIAAARAIADAIVVLGSAVSDTGRPSPGLRARLDRAMALYRDGAAPWLLMTGGGSRRMTEAEAMRRLAIAAGVPGERIVLEPTARSTFENAARSAAIVRERGWQRVILVTSWPHLPRAMLAFRAAGVRARGRAAAAAPTPRPFRRIWQYLVYESLALAWYAAVILAGRRPRG